MFKLICKTLDDRIYVIDAKNLIKSWDSEEEIEEFNDVEFDDSEFSHLEKMPEQLYLIKRFWKLSKYLFVGNFFY